MESLSWAITENEHFQVLSKINACIFFIFAWRYSSIEAYKWRKEFFGGTVVCLGFWAKGNWNEVFEFHKKSMLWNFLKLQWLEIELNYFAKILVLGFLK